MQRIEIKQVLRIATAPHDGSSILCRCPDAEARVLLHWSAEVEAWIDNRSKIYQPTHWLREVETTSYVQYYSKIDITRILSFLKRPEVTLTKRSRKRKR